MSRKWQDVCSEIQTLAQDRQEPGLFALSTLHTFGIQVEQVAHICPSELGQ